MPERLHTRYSVSITDALCLCPYGKLIIKDENFSFTLNSAKDSGTWSRFEDGDSDDSESYVLSGEQNYYIVLLSSEDDELWFLVGNASENDDSDSTMFIFEKIR